MPAPVLGPGTVRIAVRASSLNHIDLFLRRGLPGIKLELPHIPGCDASGVVTEVGEGVTTHKPGDRVLMNPSLTCGKCEFCQRGDVSMCATFKLVGEHTNGTCCTEFVLPEQNAIPFPEAMTFEDAASVPLVFVTAWRMLITRGRLRAGEDVLIHGASAGVGIACIQIAKVTGARVIAVASTDEKLELCRKLGADILLHGEKDDVVRRVREITGRRGVDVVVDYVGKATWQKSLQCASRGGRIVTCGATTGYNPEEDLRHVFYRQLEVIGSTMGSRNELMAPLKLIFEGRMRPVVSAVYDLADTAEAHRLMEARQSLGKIVIKVS
jgi:NADPH:quinone reductase-like Zn-dependent oxidoreductase